MKLFSVLSAAAGLLGLAQAQAGSVQVNFYWDEGCLDYAGSAFPSYNGAGQYSTGGPAGSQGGLYVTGDNLPFRGFSNSYDGSPFTGKLATGECIGSPNGMYAVFDV